MRAPPDYPDRKLPNAGSDCHGMALYSRRVLLPQPPYFTLVTDKVFAGSSRDRRRISPHWAEGVGPTQRHILPALTPHGATTEHRQLYLSQI